MKKVATALLALLSSSSGTGIAKEPVTRTIQTPEGPVTATTNTVNPVPQKVVAVSPKQLSEIGELASRAKSFASKYLPKVPSSSLKDFDDAFGLWRRDGTRTYTEQQVIDLLGAYLGNRMVADLDMEWVVVSDQYGTDFAVRAKKYEVMAFPFSSVAKRIERHQHDFMASVYRTVEHTIANGEVKER